METDDIDLERNRQLFGFKEEHVMNKKTHDKNSLPKVSVQEAIKAMQSIKKVEGVSAEMVRESIEEGRR